MSMSVAERLNATATGNALELRGVTRMFGALAALLDVTMTVEPGERRAVLGSNGAGKTTLFNCVTGDFLPTSGTVRLFGEDVTNFPPHERIRRGLRRTYQISLLFNGLSVIDNVYLAVRGVSRGRFSLIRPRRSEALMQSALDLLPAPACRSPERSWSCTLPIAEPPRALSDPDVSVQRCARGLGRRRPGHLPGGCMAAAGRRPRNAAHHARRERHADGREPGQREPRARLHARRPRHDADLRRPGRRQHRRHVARRSSFVYTRTQDVGPCETLADPMQAPFVLIGHSAVYGGVKWTVVPRPRRLPESFTEI